MDIQLINSPYSWGKYIQLGLCLWEDLKHNCSGIPSETHLY